MRKHIQRILLHLLRLTYRKEVMPVPGNLTKEAYIATHQTDLVISICYTSVNDRQKALADAWLAYKYVEAKKKRKQAKDQATKAGTNKVPGQL